MTTDPQPPADEVTERLRHLRGLFADMDNLIQRRAEDLAESMIRDAEARARVAVMEARGDVQRERDLVAELRKRIAVVDRMRDEMNDGRRRLAAALGESAGALPLSYFVGMAETVLAEAQKKESDSA